MKWLSQITCFLLLVAPAITASASQELPDRSDPQVLIALEQSWNEAFYEKDIPVIQGILAEEFIATYDDGQRGDKARELALVFDFDQRVESAIQDEFTVQVYDNTAVVWFTLNLVGIRQGERAEVSFRFTDVFVWRDQRWQCVSSQSTRIDEG
jgi:ketosteroid isomerase-like protein